MSKTTQPDPPPARLVEIVRRVIGEMSAQYEEAHSSPREPDPVAPRIVAISREFETDECPRHIALLAFDSPKTKATIPIFARVSIERSGGSIYALMACSEVWQKTLSEEEYKACDRNKSVKDYEGATDAILVAVYTASKQWAWSQDMRGGKRDGEPKLLNMADARGNLIQHVEV